MEIPTVGTWSTSIWLSVISLAFGSFALVGSDRHPGTRA